MAAVRSSNGGSNHLLQRALAGDFDLLASVPLVLEYEAVLTRQEHLSTSGLARGEMLVLITAVIAAAQPVNLAFRWRLMLKDPADDMVLETAVNGSADILVTFNLRDFAVVAERFGVEVLTPKQMLKRMVQ